MFRDICMRHLHRLTSTVPLFKASLAKTTTTLHTMEGYFLYFGYGSNLLRERIHIQNPTAVFKTTARLDDYKLEFDYASQRWKGAAATITESPGSHVWGVVWHIQHDQIQHLDNQEGVHTGIYKPVDVTVNTQEGEKLQCRSYYLLKRDATDKRPSPQYMDVIVRGAQENHLPPEYIEKLQAIEHNGYSGDVNVKLDLAKQCK